ncbi:MAG: GlsB/YeaQ/YmgE family stress response membrane protein [Proteobacteria bacterium]|nr:GlsB/YeaQ/YmgE family stress response membrane protein [Pseudomonadota bacterium]
MGLLWTILLGFVVGLVARAVLPGTQSLGIILTTLLGIAGAFAAGFVGQSLGWYQMGESAGFIASVVGAVVLLFVVGKLKGPGASAGS